MILVAHPVALMIFWASILLIFVVVALGSGGRPWKMSIRTILPPSTIRATPGIQDLCGTASPHPSSSLG